MADINSLLHHRTTKKSLNHLTQIQFSSLYNQKDLESFRQGQLAQFAHSWDPIIRALLKRIAKVRWIEKRRLRVFPAFDTRIRRESQPQKVTWWVEHDIPPFDRFRCAAYFVELELDDSLIPIFTIRSGVEEIWIKQPPAVVPLEVALAKIAQDPPLIIPRRMGPAHD